MALHYLFFLFIKQKVLIAITFNSEQALFNGSKTSNGERLFRDFLCFYYIFPDDLIVFTGISGVDD